MLKTDDPLGPGFEVRLHAALDRVQPPHSAPRYQSAHAAGTLRRAMFRAAPLVAVAVAGLLMTAYAATGSPNPVIWTQTAASAIGSITRGPEPGPTAEPSAAPVQEPVRRLSQPSSEQEKPQPNRETEPPEPRDESHRPDPGGSTHHLDD